MVIVLVVVVNVEIGAAVGHMADVTALLEAIERSQSEVQSVKLRIANVAGSIGENICTESQL